jgi:hypothetical protein
MRIGTDVALVEVLVASSGITIVTSNTTLTSYFVISLTPSSMSTTLLAACGVLRD